MSPGNKYRTEGGWSATVEYVNPQVGRVVFLHEVDGKQELLSHLLNGACVDKDDRDYHVFVNHPPKTSYTSARQEIDAYLGRSGHIAARLAVLRLAEMVDHLIASVAILLEEKAQRDKKE